MRGVHSARRTRSSSPAPRSPRGSGWRWCLSESCCSDGTGRPRPPTRRPRRPGRGRSSGWSTRCAGAAQAASLPLHSAPRKTGTSVSSRRTKQLTHRVVACSSSGSCFNTIPPGEGGEEERWRHAHAAELFEFIDGQMAAAQQTVLGVSPLKHVLVNYDKDSLPAGLWLEFGAQPVDSVIADSAWTLPHPRLGSIIRDPAV